MQRPIIIAIPLVLTLVLGLVLIWPKYQNFGTLQADIEKKEAELLSKTDYFSQIKEISEELEKYEESFSKILSALPEDPSLPGLFNFLQKSSSQSGLILEEIDLIGIITPKQKKESEQEAKRAKEIHVELLLNGSYLSLKDFLSVIEKSSRLIEVKEIYFASPEDPTEPFAFELKLKTSSY